MTARFAYLGLLLLIGLVFGPSVQAYENKTRLVFEIEKFPIIKITEPEIAAFPIVDQRVEILKNYLEQKKSPLASEVEYLLKQTNWDLIIAISHAESNMCKRQIGFNCWGIGGGKHRKYKTLQEGITDAQTVIGKYVARGADTPKEIMPHYVGRHSPSWVTAVTQVLHQLKQLDIKA